MSFLGSRLRNLAVLARFAARDLRGGLEGLRIFLACIALGVGAIVAVNSLARALDDGLARDGRTILGGDAAFTLIHRELAPDERAFLERARRAFHRRGAARDGAQCRRRRDARRSQSRRRLLAAPRRGGSRAEDRHCRRPREKRRRLWRRGRRRVAGPAEPESRRCLRSRRPALADPRAPRFRAGPARHRHRLRRAGADFRRGASGERSHSAGLADPLDDARPDEPARARRPAKPRSPGSSTTPRRRFRKPAGRRGCARAFRPNSRATSSISASFWRLSA